MNWDVIKGNWKQVKGSARSRWGELTGDEVDEVAGEREKLEGMIQEKYGKTKEEAKRDMDDWMAEQK